MKFFKYEMSLKDRINGTILECAHYIILALLQGYIISISWRWFVVGNFGAPELPLASAAGIVLIVALLGKEPDTPPPNSTVGFFNLFFNSTINCATSSLLIFLLLWIIHKLFS
ncbi:MAG: hypothetical protein PHQ46_09250 [Negativicutes bacterium]|nr:hypothetical protein [Negativicutes bacterium]